MKRFLLIAGMAACASGVFATESPLWLRNPAISPDGKTVVFTYKGSLYSVPSTGGAAQRLTASGSYNSQPVWSPDGTKIAFSSDREGSDDIFVMDAKGGTPRRLTTNTAAESPRAWLNDSTIVFDAKIMPTAQWAGGYFMPQTYTVTLSGGAPKLFMNIPTLGMDINGNGDVLYRNRKGYEDPLRKHERSSAPSDIFLFKNGKHTQLTTFNGQDIDPVWGPDNTFYYVTEGGDIDNLNVAVKSLTGTDKPRTLTSFKKHPVRFLTGSDTGVLCFSQDGELYTLVPGQEPKKINITITDDEYDSDKVKRYVKSGASTLAVSPDGDEVAFIIRGDVYVTSTKYKTTKRITDTAGQERVVAFSPDGRSLVYDSERNGKWQLFQAKLKNKDEKNFTYSTEIEETPLYSCTTSAQQPAYSPDGKKVAFLEDRTALKVIDLDSKKVTTALDGKYNYSYADGDVAFQWSPDSKWLLASYIGVGGWNNVDIALVKADGSEVVDLTESGYSDQMPQWVMDGKGITFATGRYGYKNHASWGQQMDIVLMMLDGDAWDEFNRTAEEAELAEKAKKDKEEQEAESKSGKKDGNSKKGKNDKKAKKDEPKALEFDLANRKYRMKRLTGESGFLGNWYLDKKGENLYYIMQNADGKFNLMKRDLKKGDTKVFAPDIDGGFEVDKKGENLYVLSGSGMSKLKLADGSSEPIEFEALYTRTPSAEREYIYDHMLRQVQAKFYDKNLHGVDWESMGEDYRRFLPYINNNRDFATLLSEILGELNASHTGGRYRGESTALQTASLGAFFDESYNGNGLKVEEVVARGPLSTKKADIKKGDIIMAIDGVDIKSGNDYYPLLEGKAGKNTILKVNRGGKEREISVRPIDAGTLTNLMYERWVEHNAAVVDSVSGGKIGYVHVKGMDAESFRRVYQDLLGKYRNCDAVVVDTRYNGGGWLHNDLMVLLSGKEYVRYEPQGRYIGSEPWAQWNKPSIMLVNEGNYSDAHGTPAIYQALKIGELAGSPVPGTMTAVWWETQIDPTLIFGIPQVTNRLMGTVMENTQLNPEVLIYNDAADLSKGVDAQLIGATRRLMEKSGK